uniref:Uncharacterized protein n=1 Tax=Anguilla anguilla TaxID=7936 RepID=A0A0E9U1M8_ANGAN
MQCILSFRYLHCIVLLFQYITFSLHYIHLADTLRATG